MSDRFQEAMPCGCVIEADPQGILHLFPCADDCPMIAAMQRQVAKMWPHVLQADARPLEEALGRGLTDEEAAHAVTLSAEQIAELAREGR